MENEFYFLKARNCYDWRCKLCKKILSSEYYHKIGRIKNRERQIRNKITKNYNKNNFDEIIYKSKKQDQQSQIIDLTRIFLMNSIKDNVYYQYLNYGRKWKIKYKGQE